MASEGSETAGQDEQSPAMWRSVGRLPPVFWRALAIALLVLFALAALALRPVQVRTTAAAYSCREVAQSAMKARKLSQVVAEAAGRGGNRGVLAANGAIFAVCQQSLREEDHPYSLALQRLQER